MSYYLLLGRLSVCMARCLMLLELATRRNFTLPEPQHPSIDVSEPHKILFPPTLKCSVGYLASHVKTPAGNHSAPIDGRSHSLTGWLTDWMDWLGLAWVGLTWLLHAIPGASNTSVTFNKKFGNLQNVVCTNIFFKYCFQINFVTKIILQSNHKKLKIWEKILNIKLL